MKKNIKIICCFFLITLLYNCTQDNYILDEEDDTITNPENTNVKG